MGKIEVEESLILDALVKRRSTVISDKQSAAVLEKNQKRDTIRKISIILRKPDAERTADESNLLDSAPQLVKHARKLQDRVDQNKQRLLEQEDPYDVIAAKARQLAEWLSCARHLICYTGAGISTAARIPDYRGSNGIWTRMQKGESIGQHDLSQAEPTFTHMALFELHRARILQYVLSQNCDGLHVRSGVPREALSEVHGNMYVEVCKACKPNREYLRVFDCTELTARFCHKTNRRCHVCGGPLVDTIVHFGERGSLRWPLNWDGASKHAERADVILCLGSSLKVLKKYSWLWQMDRPRGKRPKLCIVNLQWTPKDAFADLKVNGKCDEVMGLVMKFMGIGVRPYSRLRDPIFAHATLLTPEEEHTVTQPMLKWGGDEDNEEEEETTATEETTEAETAEDDDDDATFEEEEGNFGEEYGDECSDECVDDCRLAGEEDTDSDDGGTGSDCTENCQCNQASGPSVQVDTIKDEVADSKVEVKEESVNEVVKSEFAATCEPVKAENENAIKVEEKCSVADVGLTPTSQPTELITNGTVCQHREASIKQEKLPTSNGAPNQRTPLDPSVVILISDSDESMSSASATTYFSSTESTSNVQQSSTPSPSPGSSAQSALSGPSTPSAPSTPFRVTYATNARQSRIHKASNAPVSLPPPPPVPFFNTSPLGLRTISPQRKPPPPPLTTSAMTSGEQTLRNPATRTICATSPPRLPFWYEPNYVYAGLHTIIHPTPSDVHLFRTTTKSAHQLDRSRADCAFCFAHYAESRCMFYAPHGPEHPHAGRSRTGRLIVCECCPDDGDESIDVFGGEESNDIALDTVEHREDGGGDESTAPDDDEAEQSTSADGDEATIAGLLEQTTDDSAETTGESNEKRAKLDESVATSGARIQPGWYGKGYRKSRRRR